MASPGPRSITPKRHGSKKPTSEILSPHAMKDRDLLDLSLKELSQRLPQSTSYHHTLDIYLRWLELHRTGNTKLTEHWCNTITHWVQSLKARQFTKIEILMEVEEWKKTYEPFKSFLRRYPPLVREIHLAYDGNSSYDQSKDSGKPLEDKHRIPVIPLSSNEKLSHKEMLNQQWQGKPPGSYACDRCGKKGHYLQACPTNLDPAYDKPPGRSYQCDVCKVVGEHYKSLCPKNRDPYSLVQKRKDAQAKVALEKSRMREELPTNRDSCTEGASAWGRLSNEAEDWTYDYDQEDGQAPVLDTMIPDLLSRFETTEGRLSPEISIDGIVSSSVARRKRGHGEDLFPDALSGSVPNGLSRLNQDMTGVSRKKAKLSSGFSPDFPSLGETATKSQDTMEQCEVSCRHMQSPTSSLAHNLSEYINTTRLEGSGPNSGTTNNFTHSADALNEMGLINSLKRGKEKFSDFVQDLIERNPQMMEMVNKLGTRTTATAMIQNEEIQARGATSSAAARQYGDHSVDWEEPREPGPLSRRKSLFDKAHKKTVEIAKQGATTLKHARTRSADINHALHMHFTEPEEGTMLNLYPQYNASLLEDDDEVQITMPRIRPYAARQQFLRLQAEDKAQKVMAPKRQQCEEHGRVNHQGVAPWVTGVPISPPPAHVSYGIMDVEDGDSEKYMLDPEYLMGAIKMPLGSSVIDGPLRTPTRYFFGRDIETYYKKFSAEFKIPSEDALVSIMKERMMKLRSSDDKC